MKWFHGWPMLLTERRPDSTLTASTGRNHRDAVELQCGHIHLWGWDRVPSYLCG